MKTNSIIFDVTKTKTKKAFKNLYFINFFLRKGIKVKNFFSLINNQLLLTNSYLKNIPFNLQPNHFDNVQNSTNFLKIPSNRLKKLYI